MAQSQGQEKILMPGQMEYLSYNQMHRYYADVCWEQMRKQRYQPSVIIGLSRGGLDFGIKLSHWFQGAKFVPLCWQTRDGVTQDTPVLQAVLASTLASDQILIVDDICDSGVTLKQIQEVVAVSPRATQVTYAVAIHNVESNVDVDWYGRRINRNQEPQWFVFPWEDWYNPQL